MAYTPIENLGDLERLVTLGSTPEGLHLEFKREIRWKKKDANPTDPKELCRDIAQFANTEGGTILVGVVEKEVGDLKVAEGTYPVNHPDGLKDWIEDAITKYLVPNTLSKVIVPIQHPDGIVLAINVPPSVHLVAVWNQHDKTKGIEYLYRTNTGKEWMNPDMVERHLMDGSRAAKLRVKEIFEETKITSQVELVPPPVDESIRDRSGVRQVFRSDISAQVQFKLNSVGERELTLRAKGGTELTIPYTCVSAAWRTSDERPALALTVRVIRTENRFWLDSL